MSYCNTVVFLLIFASCVFAAELGCIRNQDPESRKNGNSYLRIIYDEMIVSDTSYRSKDEIRKVFSISYLDVWMIYIEHLNSGSLFAGEITFKIEIEASGIISQISVISSSVNNPKFDDEVKNEVKTWRFKSVEKGNVSVIVPFKFITIPFK